MYHITGGLVFVSLRWFFITILYIFLTREFDSNEVATDRSLMHFQLTSDMIASQLPFLPHSDDLLKFLYGCRSRTILQTRRAILKPRFAFRYIPPAPLLYCCRSDVELLSRRNLESSYRSRPFQPSLCDQKPIIARSCVFSKLDFSLL